MRSRVCGAVVGGIFLLVIGAVLLVWIIRRFFRRALEADRVLPCRVTLEPELKPQWRSAGAMTGSSMNCARSASGTLVRFKPRIRWDVDARALSVSPPVAGSCIAQYLDDTKMPATEWEKICDRACVTL